LVRVYLKLSNNGEVLLKLKKGELRIQQIDPPTPELLNSNWGEEQLLIDIANGATQFSWPMSWHLIPNWEKEPYKIEPGESEELVFDGIIYSEVKAIKVYTFIPNPLHGKDNNTGWRTTTEHEIPKELVKVDEEQTAVKEEGRIMPNTPSTKDIKSTERPEKPSDQKQGPNEANKNPMTGVKPKGPQPKTNK
jgi:hypothetical protein